MWKTRTSRSWTAMLLAVLVASAAATPGFADIGAVRLINGLDTPVFLTAADGDPRLFIVERPGRIVIWDDGALASTPFLDITDRVDGATGFSEGGLLSVVFPPGFAFAMGERFYVYYTGAGSGGSVLESRVARFTMGADPLVAPSGSEEILYTLGQPATNHNGGTLAWRDGWLYLGMGDGGASGETSQMAGSDFGKMLRFDPSLPAPWTADRWSSGFRNPFRFSFDRLTGDLYIGDVGQAMLEEIDVEPFDDAGGRNYGWNVHEGTDCFDADPGEPPCDDEVFTFPVHEYEHTNSPCDSVTGGVVYRGSIPEIQGHYFFGDWCRSKIWSLVWDGADGIVGERENRTGELTPDQGSIDNPVAFGEGADGELYIVDQTGEIYRVVPEPGAVAGGAVCAAALGLLARRRRAAQSIDSATVPVSESSSDSSTVASS